MNCKMQDPYHFIYIYYYLLILVSKIMRYDELISALS